MPKSSGSRSQLWNLFGWLQPRPDNLTRQEQDDILTFDQKNGFAEKPKGTTYYFDQITPNEGTVDHLAELEYMAKSEFVSPFIELIAEECAQPDINTKKTVWFTCTDGTIEEELNDMLDRVGIENIVYSICKKVAGTGNDYKRILRSQENGIEQLVSVPLTDVERVWDKTTRKLLGFHWKEQEPDTDNAIKLGQGGKGIEIFAPWEFIHFRRMEDSNTEYGTGLLDAAWPLYKRLKMATDQMVQYRMHMMPTRHAMFIDTGNKSPFEAAEEVNMFKMLLRNAMVVDPIQSRLDSRFNPPAMDSMLFFPKRKDETTSIEPMQGDKDIPDVYDMDLLWKQLFMQARVPKAYLGWEENTGIAQASLVSQDIRFARMIRTLRKPIVEGVLKLGHLHLAFKGINPSQYKIEVEMSKISALEEELNAATIERQADIANTLVGLCQSLEIPNRDIMDLVFKEYLHVPRHFIDLAKLSTAIERAIHGENGQDGAEGGAMGGMGGMMGGGFAGGLGGEMPEGEAGGIGDELGLEDEEPLPEHKSKYLGTSLNESLVQRVSGVVSEIRKHRTTLTESSRKENNLLIETSFKKIKRAISDVADIQGGGRCSGMETWKPNPFLWESAPKAGNLKESLQEQRSFAKSCGDNFTSGIVESTKTEAEEHPAVKMRRNAKR